MSAYLSAPEGGQRGVGGGSEALLPLVDAVAVPPVPLPLALVHLHVPRPGEPPDAVALVVLEAPLVHVAVRINEAAPPLHALRLRVHVTLVPRPPERHDGPITRESCGYILTMDQSLGSLVGIFSQWINHSGVSPERQAQANRHHPSIETTLSSTKL
eukprot:6802922-Pyramimonas_sp.AAC.1